MELEVNNYEAETQVGSYFVSNYPPFSTWTPDHIPAALSALDTPAPNDPPPLGLYIHIPFCRKRCTFCYFRVYTDKNARDVDQYVDALTREVALYADRTYLADRQLDFVYFGGGTPSFLSGDQIRRLVDSLAEHLTWQHAREVTFECEPGTLKKKKLETIKAIGVTRLSLGIEHWDDQVLSTNGRAHDSSESAQAYHWARDVGFQQINVDLIAGMVGDREDTWRDTVAKTMALEPDSVTIYQMEVPYNTVLARDNSAPSVPDWPTKRAWVDYAFSQFENAGYVVSSAYTLTRNSDPQCAFVYRDAVWHGADMVGTGVASFSHVAGLHYQNEDRWERYIDRLADGELPISRALPPTPHQRLIRELILQLKMGRIDANYFRRKFDVDIADTFAEPIDKLMNQGHATFDGDTLALTRDGLLRVDGLLPNFFEPQFRGIRYT